MGGSDGRQPLATVERLDVAHPEQGWQPLAPLCTPREAAAATVLGGRIYLIGGFDGTHHLSRVEVLSSALPRRSSSPSLRHSIDGQTIQEFDLLRGTWRVCSAMCEARSALCAVSIGSRSLPQRTQLSRPSQWLCNGRAIWLSHART